MTTEIAFIVVASLSAGMAIGYAVAVCIYERGIKAERMRAQRYANAVDDLDKWCGHPSVHARIIARHLSAIGEGKGLNAGTPVAHEACTIQGLRTQLERIDASTTQASLPEQNEPSHPQFVAGFKAGHKAGRALGHADVRHAIPEGLTERLLYHAVNKDNTAFARSTMREAREVFEKLSIHKPD